MTNIPLLLSALGLVRIVERILSFLSDDLHVEISPTIEVRPELVEVFDSLDVSHVGTGELWHGLLDGPFGFFLGGWGGGFVSGQGDFGGMDGHYFGIVAWVNTYYDGFPFETIQIESFFHCN